MDTTSRKARGAGPLAIGALGVVFGDIGTSPLYALQTVFSIEHNSVAPTPVDIYGVISLVFWSVLLIVTVKYVTFVMKADNEGEGGILALVALLRRRMVGRARLLWVVTLAGIVGASLFYGDSLITPAISVMSAIEGLELVSPGATAWVIPASIAVLTVLFAAQRFGTERVGRAFGPVMLLWFLVVGMLGVPHILSNPAILRAASPTYSLAFVLEHPMVAFIAMGAIVLCITGAEALYADMGHFGTRPIRTAWFAVVLPCLLLNYFGQGAMLLDDPSTLDNPFFHLAPDWARIGLVVLATAATVIASQAVISGAFSVSSQASRLGLLPRLKVVHTSRYEGGQIYISAVNWILFVGVLVLIAVFQSSSRLAAAYGLAVTGTLLLTSAVFLIAARQLWNWAWWKIVAFIVVIGTMEVAFFGANLLKIPSGGWLPLLIGAAVCLIMLTWQTGAKVRSSARGELEGPLDDFVASLHSRRIHRVPGVAVFPHPDRATTPLALRANVEFNRVLHQSVVIVSIVGAHVPHVPPAERVTVHDLGHADDGIVHVSYRTGFNDSEDIPGALALAVDRSPELHLDPSQARYFLSTLRVRGHGSRLHPRVLRALFLWLASKEANRTDVFHLPLDRTIVMGAAAEV